MFPSILILGRQPALGLAELESLYGAQAIKPIGTNAVLVNVAPEDIAFSRLGGSIKLAKVLTELDFTDWSKTVDYLVQNVPKHLDYLPEGKLKFGVSTFNLPVGTQQINRATLSVKKAIKSAGRSVRVVPNTEPALNSAQVRHNQLTSDLGMELLLIKHGFKTILAQTVQEQDIDAYAARDQGRPWRDSKVGMLPPKLAQIILNIATATSTPTGTIVLDPFCGTGVVLQEALLAGFNAYGVDLEPRMSLDYATKNLEWLQNRVDLTKQTWRCELGDATSIQWQPFDVIACETYLGRPFSALPKPEVLKEVMQDVDTIHKKFLRNVADQTQTGFRMTIAVPAWKTPQGFLHLKSLDSLEEMGYTRLKFVHVSNEDLIYHRSDQVVARELITLIRK